MQSVFSLNSSRVYVLLALPCLFKRSITLLFVVYHCYEFVFGFQIFDGNHFPDELGLIKRDLPQEVKARFVKVYIVNWKQTGISLTSAVCTNIEFFGC